MFRLSKDVNDEQQSNNPPMVWKKVLKNRLKATMKIWSDELFDQLAPK
jgi:hypothetical protein